mgnify:CR=1 FL=1
MRPHRIIAIIATCCSLLGCQYQEQSITISNDQLGSISGDSHINMPDGSFMSWAEARTETTCSRRWSGQDTILRCSGIFQELTTEPRVSFSYDGAYGDVVSACNQDSRCQTSAEAYVTASGQYSQGNLLVGSYTAITRGDTSFTMELNFFDPEDGDPVFENCERSDDNGDTWRPMSASSGHAQYFEFRLAGDNSSLSIGSDTLFDLEWDFELTSDEEDDFSCE